MNSFGPHRLPSYLVIMALAISNASLPSRSDHLVKQIQFGAAEGGHEYCNYLTFDAAKRRLYLSHGTEVKVIDADAGDGAKTMALDPPNAQSLPFIVRLWGSRIRWTESRERSVCSFMRADGFEKLGGAVSR